AFVVVGLDSTSISFSGEDNHLDSCILKLKVRKLLALYIVHIFPEELNSKMANFITITAPTTLDDAIFCAKKVEAKEYYGKQTSQQALQQTGSDMETLLKAINGMSIDYPI
ncbi:7172_t:CDS:2, partial [Dentiscutata heterogama]